MNSSDLREWQAKTGHTFRSAAAELDVSLATYSNWMAGAKISKIVAFALAAVAAGIEPWGQRPADDAAMLP